MRMAVKNMLRKNFLDCLILALLAIAFALNYELFIAKNSFAPAGVNGIATMVEYKTGFSVGYFSLIVNVPLCLFAFFLSYGIVSLNICLMTAVAQTRGTVISEICTHVFSLTADLTAVRFCI